MSVNRPHESPECRCEGCVAYTAEAERIRGVLAEACDRARAMLTGALDRMPDTEPAPAERRKVYYVDESTVSFDSLDDTRPFVGYAVDLPALPFPVPHDAVAVDVITGGSFVFRGERCEACARIGDTVTTDGYYATTPNSGTIDPSHYRNGFMSEREVVTELARRDVVSDAGDEWVDGAVRHLAQLQLAHRLAREDARRYAELHGFAWGRCPKCGEFRGSHESIACCD